MDGWKMKSPLGMAYFQGKVTAWVTVTRIAKGINQWISKFSFFEFQVPKLRWSFQVEFPSKFRAFQNKATVALSSLFLGKVSSFFPKRDSNELAPYPEKSLKFTANRVNSIYFSIQHEKNILNGGLVRESLQKYR